MIDNKSNLGMFIASQLKMRNNPPDLKECNLAIVINTEPVILKLADAQIILTEGENLYISEAFRFRCNIDKTKLLSNDVISNTNNAASITEIHSYTGNNCNMPNAVKSIIKAILNIRDELKALKCELKINDKVIVAPMAEDSQYTLIDKII